MSALGDRRAFLRGLTTLPLIGGGVALLGAPSAVAEPVTDALLEAYSEWLYQERRALCRARFPSAARPQAWIPTNTGATDYHFPRGPDGRQVWDLSGPAERAALVLSTVGCDWREGGA